MPSAPIAQPAPSPSPSPVRRNSRRPRWGDLGRAVLGLLASALGLALAAWLLPGLELPGWGSALAVALAISVTSFVLRPLLVAVAARLGWPGAVILAVFGQAFVVWLVLMTVGDVGVDSFLVALLAAWIVALVSTTVVWALTAGSDDAVTASLLRRARRRPMRMPDPDTPGVVFVQLDGVPFPVLQMGVLGGTLPTLSRWVRTGTHRMAEWRPTLPATTPASQMGILHGTTTGIPAFRWVDRDTGRVFVANKPADAVDIEALHSDGHGLLADDGVSVSNLFTGDAVLAYATMSAIGRTEETLETRSTVAHFLARPDGLARGVSRTVSEIVRERFQAARAVRRDLRPRVHRGWSFAVERAGLSGVLRDLNTSLVAESMLRGRRAIYVDYVDYDAVAHHAGVLRAESLSALEGLDAVLASLEEVAAVAPRPYRFVVLSDHGQSQGEVFADRYGEDLATLVARLARTTVPELAANPEAAGRLNAIFAGAGSTDTAFGRALSRVSERLTKAQDEPEPEPGAEEPAQFVVFGSGNLGLVYAAGERHRLTLEELTDRFPALVPGLVVHPGVGFVVVETAEHGPVAIGAGGENRVREGTVVGEDPLAPFGPDAAAFVLRASSMDEAPDVYVNSLLDEMGEVAAFEGLVGCHGGLGGWQDRAMVVWPADLPAPEGMVVGADAMHDVLVGWLHHLGHRQALPPRRVRPYDARRAASGS